VATALLRARAVDRVVCFVAPVVLGAGIDAVGDLNVLRVPDGIRLRDTTVERVGEDVMIAGTPVYPVMRDE
jgi:diaminohydroxyphosphoribosylaminopyrimidine deaminase/5-amino-6-(5-phosphoribosylamino)uracil reductase